VCYFPCVISSVTSPATSSGTFPHTLPLLLTLSFPLLLLPATPSVTSPVTSYYFSLTLPVLLPGLLRTHILMFSVSVVKKLGAASKGTLVQITPSAKQFSLYQFVQTCSRADQSTNSMDARGPISGTEVAGTRI
jgi:hypothetical protein